MNIILYNKNREPVFQLKTKLTRKQKIDICSSIMDDDSVHLNTNTVELNFEMTTPEAIKLVKGYNKYLK